MSVPNPKDPLYWCAAAYKSMGNETFYNASRGEETTGKDVKFEIEMIVPDAEENGVKGLKKAETFVVAFRESEFMHLTGKQHFSDDKTTNDSKKFLRDCLNGNVDMTTFAGQTYEIEKNGYGFLDRIEALKNFKKLMCSIPERSNEEFGIYTVHNVIVTNIVTIKKSQELYLGNIPMKHNDTGYTHTENVNVIQGLALADESGKIVYNPESEQTQQAEEQEEHHSQSSYDIDI